MTRWTHDHPGAGSTAALRTAAVTLGYVAERLEQARRDLGDAGREADDPSVWQGEACDVWRTQRDELERALRPVADVCDDNGRALVAYADEVEDIDARGKDALAEREDATQELVAARRAAFVSGLETFTTPPRVSSTGPYGRTPAERTLLAEQAVRDAERRLTELEERRRDADRALERALVPLGDDDWAELGRAMADAGFARPDQMHVDSLGAALGDALRGAFSDGADLDGLRALLAAWGDSPSVLGAALADLGGHGLTALLHALEVRAVGTPADAGAVAATQEALRTALAIGSRVWDRGTVGTVTEGLLSGPNAALAVAYLFGDPVGAAMAPALVRGTADRLHALEQAEGGPVVWQFDPSAGGVGPMAAGLGVPLGPPSPYSVIDPAGSVFRQLSRLPALALDWFADAAAGTDRVTYWFGERDWVAGGGFAPLLLVWESMQGLPGALVGPGVDEALARRLADVNAGVLNALLQDGRLPAHGLGPEAAMALAGVLERQLPIWLETVVMQAGPAYNGAWTHVGAILWMADGTGPSVLVGKRWLQELMRRVAEDPAASLQLAMVVSRLQVRLMQSAGSTGLSHVQLAERYAELLGAVDRAKLGNELAAARRADEDTGRVIALGQLLLGEALDAAAGPVGGVAAGAAGEAATEVWASRYRDALDGFYANDGPAQARTDAAKVLLEVMVGGWVPPDVVAANGGLDQLVRQLLDNYVDERGW